MPDSTGVEEYGLSVDTSLHYMVWQPDDLQSRLARHRMTLHGWMKQHRLGQTLIDRYR